MEPTLEQVIATLNHCASAEAVRIALMTFLRLPKLRAVQVGRFLKYCDARFSLYTFEDIGKGALETVASILNIALDSYKPSAGDLQKVRAAIGAELKSLDSHRLMDKLGDSDR